MHGLGEDPSSENFKLIFLQDIFKSDFPRTPGSTSAYVCVWGQLSVTPCFLPSFVMRVDSLSTLICGDRCMCCVSGHIDVFQGFAVVVSQIILQ